jgi:hypothetical protein
MNIYLAPPRTPGSTNRKERNWTLVLPRPWGTQHTALYGTHANDPEGAQAAANNELNHEYTWVPNGHGFKTEMESTINAQGQATTVGS